MKRILFATLFTLIATTFSFAQTQLPAPQLSVVTVTHVKPGMMSEYQEFMKNETLAAFKKAGGKQWATFTNATFGTGGMIVSLRTIASMKDFDEPNFILKALGEDGARVWGQKRARLIDGVETYLLRGLPELYIPRPTTDEPPKLGALRITTVAPGRTADYERVMKNDILPLLKKTGSKGYATGRVVFGGDVNEYRSLSYADSFEDIEKRDQALQAAGLGTASAKLTGIVLHTERTIVRYMPELSVRPEPQKAARK